MIVLVGFAMLCGAAMLLSTPPLGLATSRSVVASWRRGWGLFQRGFDGPELRSHGGRDKTRHGGG